ncbi:MAG: hypothetical protein ACRDD7_11200 [Peptostreptococcaceae bacterium]
MFKVKRRRRLMKGMEIINSIEFTKYESKKDTLVIGFKPNTDFSIIDKIIEVCESRYGYKFSEFTRRVDDGFILEMKLLEGAKLSTVDELELAITKLSHKFNELEANLDKVCEAFKK